MTTVTYRSPTVLAPNSPTPSLTFTASPVSPGDWVYVFAASDDDGTSPIVMAMPKDPDVVIESVLPWFTSPAQPSVGTALYRFQVPWQAGLFNGQIVLTSVKPRNFRVMMITLTGATAQAGRLQVSQINFDVAATGFSTVLSPGVQIAGSGNGLVLCMALARTDTSAFPPSGFTSGMTYLGKAPTITSMLPVIWGRVTNVANGTVTPDALATMNANPYAARVPGSVIGYQLAIPTLDDDPLPPVAPGYDNRITVDGWVTTDGPVPAIDALGNTWVLQNLEGWFGGVDIRANAVDRPLADGVIDGPAPFTGRSVTITGTLISRSRALLQQAFDTLASVLSSDTRVGTLEVYERVRELSRQATVRLDGPVLIDRLSDVSAKFSLPLFAPDSNRYSVTRQSVTVTVYKTSGGRTYNLTYPRVYGAGGSTGQIDVVNRGNRTAWPTFTIAGQYITNPAFRLVGGPTIKVLTTLTYTDVLVVDSANRTIKINDYSRRAQLSSDSEWWGIPPGLSTILFTCDNPGLPPQTATISWRDTYS